MKRSPTKMNLFTDSLTKYYSVIKSD